MIKSDSAAKTEQIREVCDIVDVVSSYVTLKRAGKDFKALCPFHNEKTPSFYVVPDKQIFKCFGCGAAGDVFKFIQAKEGLGFVEAREMLARRAGVSLDDEKTASQRSDGPTKSDLERVNRWACRWFQLQLTRPEAAPILQYVAGRGIDRDSVRRFDLGYAPESWDALTRAAGEAEIPVHLLQAAGLVKPRSDGSAYDAFRHRLIFPIRDPLDRIIGFGGRALGDDSAKYLNSPQSQLFDKRRCLYGLSHCKEAFADTRRAIVVEGYVDCILAHQCGFRATVATLGTALTPEHARILRRYVDAVVMVFDADEAGQRATDKALPLVLAENLDVRLAQVPEGQDPADMLAAVGSQAFERILTSAVDALEFKWQEVRRRYRDAERGLDRRRAVEAFLLLVSSSTDFGTCDPIQRGLILNQVGKLLGLSAEEVHRQLRIIERRSESRTHSDFRPQENFPAVPDAATAAIRDLLGVLLNDPGFHPDVVGEIDVDLLADAELREITLAVLDATEPKECFSLPRLMSRFESVDAARRIMDLKSCGERIGNFAATVEGALGCLRTLKQQQQLARLTDALRMGDQTASDASPPPSSADAPSDERDRTQAHRAAARKVSHFAARKDLRARRNATASPHPANLGA